MLLNELHQGGIRALLSWDSSIFDNMALPEDIQLADIVDHIIFKYGDTPLMAPDPEVMKYYIARWSARRLPLWEKYKAAVEAEYNPIENYDRNENITRQFNSTTTQTGDTTSQRAADNSANWENYDKDNVNLTNGGSGGETINSRVHGNIGVTTAMQMQNAYFDILPRFDVIDYIVDDWHDEFCLLMY